MNETPSPLSPGTASTRGDRARPYLSWTKRVLDYSLKSFFVGLLSTVLMLAVALACASRVPNAVETTIGGLFCVCVLALAAGVLGTLIATPLWFLIVFFCYTRYSLRSMLITVLLFTALLSLIVAGNLHVRLLTAPLMLAFLLELAFRIAVNDPLIDPTLRNAVEAHKGKQVNGR